MSTSALYTTSQGLGIGDLPTSSSGALRGDTYLEGEYGLYHSSGGFYQLSAFGWNRRYYGVEEFNGTTTSVTSTYSNGVNYWRNTTSVSGDIGMEIPLPKQWQRHGDGILVPTFLYSSPLASTSTSSTIQWHIKYNLRTTGENPSLDASKSASDATYDLPLTLGSSGIHYYRDTNFELTAFETDSSVAVGALFSVTIGFRPSASVHGGEHRFHGIILDFVQTPTTASV